MKKITTVFICCSLMSCFQACTPNKKESAYFEDAFISAEHLEQEIDSTPIQLTTFGLQFDSDPRFGFDNCSVKIPEIKGLHVLSRWAYCKKDSCNTGSYVLGIRCPRNIMVRQWVSNKLWEQMTEKRYGKKASQEIVDNVATSSSKIASFYLNQWNRHYNHYLNDYKKCESTGKFAFPTEQYGLIIADVWKYKRYYTMCVHSWYDMMSNGCPYATSFYTIDATTGKELSLSSFLSKNDCPKVNKLLRGKLAWMKKQREALPLENIDPLENCTGVALVEEGLLVYFHPYAIGAGYEGQYNVVIPYEQLRESGVTLKQ